jgi:Mg-chelatase subunit ChlD
MGGPGFRKMRPEAPRYDGSPTMRNSWRGAGAVWLASELALASAACHSGLHVPRDAAVESAPTAADGQESADMRAAADATLADAVEAKALDARWSIPDGLGPICLTMVATSAWAWADVLAVIDRSSSMGLGMAADVPCEPGAGDCTTRWDAVKSALLEVGLVQPHFRWGTLMFPSPGSDGCAVAPAPEVPVMENAADAIERAMTTAAPGGETPTGAAISAAAAYLAGLAEQDYKAMMLFTDGEPSCSGVDSGSEWSDALAAATAASAQGYPIFVFGLGPNPGDLEQLAKAGGTDRHFSATSRQQLENALDSLFFFPGDVRTCTFSTYEPPPDPTQVYVFINGELIPQDGNDGWTFDWANSSIVLNGRSCELTLTLNPVEVAVLFGCGDAGPP